MVTRKAIYLAGALFTPYERRFLRELAASLAKRTGLDPHRDFFVPHRDAGLVGDIGSSEAFESDVEALESAELIVALLDGTDVDSGTAFEMGFAFARGRPILGLTTDLRLRDGQRRVNNMIHGACGNGERIYRKTSELAKALREIREK
jgi:nucleoside 2-deoxyribosyltransferase